MNWTVFALAFALALAGCQKGRSGAPAGAPAAAAAPAHAASAARAYTPSTAPVTAAYRADIKTLCNCVHLSGADQHAKSDPNGRMTMIAMWLGKNIHTAQAHKFLVAIQPLVGERKAHALDAEAQRVGLAGCPLSAEWRK